MFVNSQIFFIRRNGLSIDDTLKPCQEFQVCHFGVVLYTDEPAVDTYTFSVLKHLGYIQ